MSAPLPPVLDDLGDQLRAAVARDIEVERRVAQRVRRGRGRRWLLVVGGVAISFASVAGADRLLDREGAPIRGDDQPAELAPAADPGVIATSATDDPDGGPPWALRVFTNPGGLDCVALGRLRDGTLGTYDDTRTFRALPVNVSGTCERLAEAGLLAVVQRRAVPLPRTIVYGIARDREPVRLTIGGQTRVLEPGALGSFIDVREGLPDMRGASATTTAGARTVERQLGP